MSVLIANVTGYLFFSSEQINSLTVSGCGGIAIANGEIDFSEGTDYNSTAMVRCSDGYHLTGPGTVYCMASGRWKKTSACEINGIQPFSLFIFFLISCNPYIF